MQPKDKLLFSCIYYTFRKMCIRKNYELVGQPSYFDVSNSEVKFA